MSSSGESSPADARPARGQSRLWLVPATIVVGTVAASIVIALLRAEPPRTVSEVRSEIASVVLRKSTLPNADDGGLIGPWWVAAVEGDPETGLFRDFHLRSGSLQLAARRARLAIDPDAASFSFELKDVVLLSAPAEMFEESTLGGLAEIEFFTLGPVPLRGRVIPDEAMPPMEVVRAAPGR